MRRENQRERNYIAGLDGLRGIAVIGVILFHMFPGVWKGGYAGVLLFFVLSGYLLARTSQREGEAGRFSMKTFYRKRIQRIYPSLIIVVFVTLGALTIFAPKVLIGMRQEVLSIFLGYNNLWQIGQNASYFTRIANASPFTHFWSLAIEMQFYLIWPLLFLAYQKLRGGRFRKYAHYLMLVFAVLSAGALAFKYVPGEDVTPLYYGTDTRIFALFLGAFLGFCQEAEDRSGSRAGWSPEKGSARSDAAPEKRTGIGRYLPVLLFALGMILLLPTYLLMDGEAELTYRFGLFAVSVCFCGMVAITAAPGLPVGRFLERTPLTWLGKKSYEIYLWQYPVIFLFQYKKWDRSWFAPVIMLVLILALSCWLQVILRWMREKIYFGGRNVKYIKKSVIGFMTVVLMFAFVLGGCSLFTASGDDGEQKQLEEELKKNAEELEGQKTEETQAGEGENDGSQKVSAGQTSGDGTQSSQQDKTAAESGFITAIGDSVMLGAAPALQEMLPGCVVDAKESRQVVKSKATVEELRAQGKLGDTVILGLGTNGPFKVSVGQELLDAIGSEKTVYWVTVYGEHLQWQEDSNSTIRQLAQQNKNVHIIDWAAEAAAHPEWFYNDGIHLKPSGQEAYARLIFQSVTQ